MKSRKREFTPPRNPYASSKRIASTASKQTPKSDDGIQVLSPPRGTGISSAMALHQQPQFTQPGMASTNPTSGTNDHGNSKNNNDDDDDVQIEYSNAINSLVEYPHGRPDCGVFPFSPENASQCCDKCYCLVCQKPAKECSQWQLHCSSARPTKSSSSSNDGLGDDDDVQFVGIENRPTQPRRFQRRNNANNTLLAAARRPLHGAAANDFMDDEHDDEFHMGHLGQIFESHYTNQFNHHYNKSMTNDGAPKGEKRRHPADTRIHEILAENLSQAILLSEKGGTKQPLDITKSRKKRFDQSRMEGDIPQLGLFANFFVQGVRIGWPYPQVMKPQRQMALHLIKALKDKKHVVLESPTGTGKSAAILCTALAWQRYHVKTTWGQKDNNNKEDKPASLLDKMMPKKSTDEEAFPKIIYCSRTHSQVAQMVASLKKTPYRPRMTVLGSRDRTCIHKSIHNRGPPLDGDGEATTSTKAKVNINSACQVRVRNTEKARRYLWRSVESRYNDDSPPLDWKGDGAGGGEGNDEENEGGWTEKGSSKKPTCPHYRQLTSKRTAQMLRSKFLLDQNTISSCQVGGEQTKLGVHDIEDLVSFGVNPYKERKVPIYRRSNTDSWGLQLGGDKNNVGCHVSHVIKGGAAESNPLIRANDVILAVNGTDVENESINQVSNEIRKTQGDLLELDLRRPASRITVNGGDEADEDDVYSPHSACPLYLSRALAKHAELIFAPYNYVLDPGIRASLDIDLAGAIVVLDEAHNVPDTLAESGSGKWGEIEISGLLSMLAYHSSSAKSSYNSVETESGETKDIPEIAHALLLFVEKMLMWMRGMRLQFEKSPGKVGAKCVIEEYQRYHTQDDTAFEMAYFGPNGHGVNRKAVGCQPFFDKLEFSKINWSKLAEYAKAMESYLGGSAEEKERDPPLNAAKPNESTAHFEILGDLISKFSLAGQNTEHFMVQIVVQANGSLDYASGMELDEIAAQRFGKFKKKPKKMAFTFPRNDDNQGALLPVCNHADCKTAKQVLDYNSGVRHGQFGDGTTPRWECHIVLKLLFPGLLMSDLSNQCRSVVLASGSLAPLKSMCAELDLKDSETEKTGRLQTKPPPLEADHIVNLEKQLLAVSVGHFPDGSPLTVTYNNYQHPEFFKKLGLAIAQIVESIPHGGVLVFLPSYAFLKKCVKCWNPDDGGRNRWGGDDNGCPEIWDRFLTSHGKVVVEPSGGGQEKFEEAKEVYSNEIKTRGKCLLLAVFRGKMSEGISFNDDNARGVICVGLPFPNARDSAITAKKHYNDEQRKLKNRTNLLPGMEWYCTEAYRAIAQALGRCIRHSGDYGTVILMDKRQCNDGSPGFEHSKLPKWMRHHVRTMSMSGSFVGKNPVQGGYAGLSREMASFFRQAPDYTRSVLDETRRSFEAAQARERESGGHKFNSHTGAWLPNPSSATTSSDGSCRSSAGCCSVTQESPAPTQLQLQK